FPPSGRATPASDRSDRAGAGAELAQDIPDALRQDHGEVAVFQAPERSLDRLRFRRHDRNGLSRPTRLLHAFRDEPWDLTRPPTTPVGVFLDDEDVERSGGMPDRADILVASISGDSDDPDPP